MHLSLFLPLSCLVVCLSGYLSVCRRCETSFRQDVLNSLAVSTLCTRSIEAAMRNDAWRSWQFMEPQKSQPFYKSSVSSFLHLPRCEHVAPANVFATRKPELATCNVLNPWHLPHKMQFSYTFLKLWTILTCHCFTEPAVRPSRGIKLLNKHSISRFRSVPHDVERHLCATCCNLRSEVWLRKFFEQLHHPILFQSSEARV